MVIFLNISGIWLSGGESDEHRRSPDEEGINKDIQTMKSRGEEDWDLDLDLGGETVREVDVGSLGVTGILSLEGWVGVGGQSSWLADGWNKLEIA